MKLEFRLLVVDDVPDNIDSAVGILDDYLETKSFTLNSRVAEDLSEEGLRGLARDEGKNYDLVMIDYDLGRDATNGARAANRLRYDLPYTDIVFYSSNSEANLLGELAEQAVSGVFVARREDLDTALIGIADTVIGKAVDLSHMRGIAMAEVAEMDVLMQDTVAQAFRYVGNQCLDKAARRTRKRLRESITEHSRSFNQRLKEDGLPIIVGDSRLFSSMHKFHAVKRIASCLPEPPYEALQALDNYEADVIHKRNMLAHVKEVTSDDGNAVLHSIVNDQDEVIDEVWMTGFRQTLRTHKAALDVVCSAIDNQFGVELNPEEGDS